MPYRGFPTVDDYTAYKVTEQSRFGDVPRCGAELCFEVLDNADPAQLDDRVVAHVPCVCGLEPARADFAFCTCGAAQSALSTRDELRRQYATQIDLGANL